MKTKLMLVGLGLVIFSSTTALADLDPLEPYDNFNAKKYNGCKFCINSEKWTGLQRGNNNTEALREIRSKRLRMTNRTWGEMTSDADTTDGRNRVRFRNSIMFSGVCFVPRVRKYQIQNCAANTDHGHARIRYLGNFFDTGVVNDDGDNGVVYAGISLIRHGNTTDKKGIFEISAWASECTDTDCDTEGWTTYDGTNDPDLFFGTTKANKNKKAICIGYDRATPGGALVFSYGNDIRVVDNSNHDLPPLGRNLSANQSWHVIEARNDVESCTTDKLTGYVDADADNVKVRKYTPGGGTTYSVGDTGPAGGIVFYVTNGGANGLEASLADQAVPPPGVSWGCTGVDLAGADGTAIGTGAQNTADILTGCADPGIAAQLADAFSLNGFTDWFLPSKDELNELMLNQFVVGGIAFGQPYYSSSEINSTGVWAHDSGSAFGFFKNSSGGVRAIRAF